MNASLIALAESLVGWLADFYLLATLLLGLSFLGLRWVRQPVHRLSVAWIVMIELGVLAVLCAMPGWPRISLVPAAPKAALPAPLEIELQSSPEPAVGWVERSADPPARLPSPMVGQRSARPTLPDVQPRWTFALPSCSVLLGGAFMLGMALVGCWLGWGAVATVVLCHRAMAAPPGLMAQLSEIVRSPRLPRLLLSGQIGNAVALGIVRPAILLPANLAKEGPPQSLRVVLAHEWAHIRNHDLWLLALGRCLLAILFAHPLFWWLRRRVRNDQEMVADAVAARENRPEYAEELVQWVRLTAGLPSAGVSAAVGIWESPSQLTRRIATLLDESFHVQTSASRRWKFQAVGLLVLLGTACSLVTLQPSRLAGEPASAASPANPEPEKTASPIAAQPAPAAKPPERGQSAWESAPGSDLKWKFLMYSGGRIDDKYPVRVPGMGERGTGFTLNIAPYDKLIHHALVAELHLTDEQKTNLREIAKSFRVDLEKFNTEAKGLSPDEEKLARSRWEGGQRKVIREQLEKALAPEQMQTLNRLTFSLAAYDRLQWPKYRKELGMTKEQEDQLRPIGEWNTRWMRQNHRETFAKTMAVLNPQQRARLRAEELGPLMGRFFEVFVNVEGQTEPARAASLIPYRDFSDEEVQKELGLSAAQRQQVREILGDSPNLTDKLVREAMKLSPEERKKPYALAHETGEDLQLTYPKDLSPEEQAKRSTEFVEKLIERRKNRWAELEKQPMVKTCIALRKQFEAILTPEQLASYKDMAVRESPAAIGEYIVLKQIGGNDEQYVALQRIEDEYSASVSRHFWEMGEKMLAILTPAQQEKVHEDVFSSPPHWFGPPSAKETPAASPAASKTENKANSDGTP